MVTILHRELERKVEKVKHMKLEVMRPKTKNNMNFQPRGVARFFQRGGVTIRGSPTVYGLYRCSPSCISGLSRIIVA